MKVKFNKFERVAGLFVLSTILGCLLVVVTMAVKKGWFSSKVDFKTVLTSAEGIHEGTEVQISGLRAGSVVDVKLVKAETVEVRLSVFEEFNKLIREDSQVQVVRPFVIGDKVIDVTVGDENLAMSKPGSLLPSKAAFDVMDLLSGRKLGPFLASLEGLAKNLSLLAEAFADTRRIQAFVKMFDELEPMIKNVNQMAKGFTDVAGTLNKQKRLETMVPQMVTVITSLHEMIPTLQRDLPEVYPYIPRLVKNLEELTEEFKKITPAIAAVAPELPRASLRAVELLDEAVVLMKAMQKSFLLSGKVEDVKEEEAKKKRSPAQEGP